MRLSLLCLALTICACVHNEVQLPRTPAAMSCKRECMSVYHQCREHAGRLICSDEQDECLLTCPGARVVQVSQ